MVITYCDALFRYCFYETVLLGEGRGRRRGVREGRAAECLGLPALIVSREEENEEEVEEDVSGATHSSFESSLLRSGK